MRSWKIRNDDQGRVYKEAFRKTTSKEVGGESTSRQLLLQQLQEKHRLY